MLYENIIMDISWGLENEDQNIRLKFLPFFLNLHINKQPNSLF